MRAVGDTVSVFKLDRLGRFLKHSPRESTALAATSRKILSRLACEGGSRLYLWT